MTNDILAGTHGRLIWVAKGYLKLYDAVRALTEANDALRGTNVSGETYPAEVDALERLTDATRSRVLEIAAGIARQLGWQVAMYDIAKIAWESGDEPIAWLTGNSMVPPLRELGYANAVWNLDEPELWEAFVDGVENRLDELRVHMGAPEYDNSLYVVDLARFEHVEDAEGDSLEDEWQPISD